VISIDGVNEALVLQMSVVPSAGPAAGIIDNGRSSGASQLIAVLEGSTQVAVKVLGRTGTMYQLRFESRPYLPPVFFNFTLNDCDPATHENIPWSSRPADLSHLQKASDDYLFICALKQQLKPNEAVVNALQTITVVCLIAIALQLGLIGLVFNTAAIKAASRRFTVIIFVATLALVALNFTMVGPPESNH